MNTWGTWTPQQIEALHQELRALDHGFYRLMASRCEHGILMSLHCEKCYVESLYALESSNVQS